MCKITFFSNLNKKMSKNLDDKNNKVDLKEVNKKDTNTSKKIDKKFKINEKDKADSDKKDGKNKWNLVLKIFIIILIILIILELTTGVVSLSCSSIKHILFRMVGIEAKEGNTIGNINNFGYVAEDSKYLYYMCPNENGQYIGISKVSKKDLTGKQTRLVEGTWEIASINSYGDYIYFVSLSRNNVDENDTNADEVDNKIHRVNKNGDQKDEILNDNEFHNYAYKITVVGGKIYYIGEDECIWYMDLDGNHKTRLNENASGFEAINDKYILYNMPAVKDGEESSISWIMDRNGKNAREINGKRIYTPILYKDYIYYLTEDRYLHRMGIDGKNDEMLSDTKIYNLNVSENGIYYFKEKFTTTGEISSVVICRMDLDGKNNKQIYSLEESSTSLCLLNDWIFFLDSNEEEGKMEIISPDGKQKIDLFVLYYSDYYYLDELKEQRENEALDAVEGEGSGEGAENGDTNVENPENTSESTTPASN